MKTFIQLKDGVGFAFIDTIGEVDGIEVPNGTGEDYLNKAYIDGHWFDAQEILYADINEDGYIVEVFKTFFPSNVSGPIIDESITGLHRWINGEWVAPVVIQENIQQDPVEIIPTEPEQN